MRKKQVSLRRTLFIGQSAPGEGTRMRAVLPAASATGQGGMQTAAAAAENAIAASPVVTEGRGPYAVLVVDDDYSNLRALLNTLSPEQYRMTAVTRGEEALRLLEGGNRCDLCIVDATMPGLSGYDLCRAIRKQFSLLELPILLVTVGSRVGDLEAGFAAGANDFLIKPYDAVELNARVRALAELRQSAGRLVQQERAFLQAQIKPHFLFNTLNTILSLSYSDHVKARQILTEFSIYLRCSFDFKEYSAMFPLSKEVALLKAYVAIEKARFGDQLEVEFAIDPAALHRPFLSLTLQPIVENAIQHGIMKKEEGGKVTISIRLNDGLEIVIADNGSGFPENAIPWREMTPKRTGGGLANIERRLQALYGTGLHIVSKQGQGTVVTLRIPDRRQEDAVGEG